MAPQQTQPEKPSVYFLDKSMLPVVLKTKYAFHALLWLLNPDVALDIGSMDGADSKRFRTLLKKSDLVAL
jgi:hypothetical protein